MQVLTSSTGPLRGGSHLEPLSLDAVAGVSMIRGLYPRN
jgi:hypothetical protein